MIHPRPAVLLSPLLALAALSVGCPDPCAGGEGAGDDEEGEADEGAENEEDEEENEGVCGAAKNAFAATPPADAPAGATCSTDLYWQRGDSESALMHPGKNCISCHAASGEGPDYTVAGTVMGALDDADDCQGISDVTVRITDANGVVTEMTTNSAGNFFSKSAIATPFTAEVRRGGATSVMATPQTETNCMVCHTSTGAQDAPGRIVAP